MTRNEAKERLKPEMTVRVARKIDPCREHWIDDMDGSVGRDMKVLRVSANGGVALEDGYWYPPEALELARFGNEED